MSTRTIYYVTEIVLRLTILRRSVRQPDDLDLSLLLGFVKTRVEPAVVLPTPQHQRMFSTRVLALFFESFLFRPSEPFFATAPCVFSYVLFLFCLAFYRTVTKKKKLDLVFWKIWNCSLAAGRESSSNAKTLLRFWN